MTEYSKYNIVYRLQKWMDSVSGQTFLNYAYSWGASIVILGTLFKLTHLPGANLMLYIGMGTEVIVFFISAFDRPFDKTAIGMDLQTSSGLAAQEAAAASAEGSGQPTVIVGSGATGGGTIVIGGSSTAGSRSVEPVQEHVTVSDDMQDRPVAAPPLTPEMTDATNAYVEELKKLTEVLEKVSMQSQRLTTDSEEMENLNRTLTGICKVYEMQLRSASSQIGTIDQINEQTKKMAQQIEQLNKIYARMIEAMTVNMSPLGGLGGQNSQGASGALR